MRATNLWLCEAINEQLTHAITYGYGFCDTVFYKIFSLTLNDGLSFVQVSISIIDMGYSKDYYAFMNETDLKAIEELLNKQAEAFTKQMDAHFETQEKNLDLRFQEQEERLEKRMIHVFNEGFEQVVFPHIIEIKENISSMKEDISSIKEDVDDLKHRSDRMERKLDAVVEYQDRQGQEIKAIKKFIRMPEGA